VAVQSSFAPKPAKNGSKIPPLRKALLIAVAAAAVLLIVVIVLGVAVLAVWKMG
jgi:hypothetical protein